MNMETNNGTKEAGKINACFYCKKFYSESPSLGNPQHEFTCKAGHWSCISCQEDYDTLFEETDCKDFTSF